MWRRNHPTRPTLDSARTGGRLVYAVGDVHGRYDLLCELLEQIVADRRRSAVAEPPLLIFLGDYVDRGPSSAEVVESVIWLSRRREFEVRALKGNHEAALLDFLEDPVAAASWLDFGGDATLRSYGAPVPTYPDEDVLGAAGKAFAGAIPESHKAFLGQLELQIVVGDYAFVHAGVRPGVALEAQAERDLLWIRREFLRSDGPFEKVIVHGHTWEAEPQVLPHRLGVDTGAYATGVLTAARIDDAGVSFLQTSKPTFHVEPETLSGQLVIDTAEGRGLRP